MKRSKLLAFIPLIAAVLVGGAGNATADPVATTSESTIHAQIGGSGNPFAINMEFLINGMTVRPGDEVRRIWTPEEFWPAFGGLTAKSYDASRAEGIPLVKAAILEALATGKPVRLASYSQSGSVASGALEELAAEGVSLHNLTVAYASNPRTAVTGLEARLAGFGVPGITAEGPVANVAPGASWCWRYDPVCNAPVYFGLVDLANAYTGYMRYHGRYFQVPTEGRTYEHNGIVYTTFDDGGIPLVDTLHDLGVNFGPLDRWIAQNVTNTVDFGPGPAAYSVQTPAFSPVTQVAREIPAVAQEETAPALQLSQSAQQLSQAVSTGQTEDAKDALADVGAVLKNDPVGAQVAPTIDQGIAVVNGLIDQFVH